MKSHCSSAIFLFEIGLQRPEFTVFPVKFPVSREFAWRRVRSALRRQPASFLGSISPVARRKDVGSGNVGGPLHARPNEASSRAARHSIRLAGRGDGSEVRSLARTA